MVSRFSTKSLSSISVSPKTLLLIGLRNYKKNMKNNLIDVAVAFATTVTKTARGHVVES